MVKAKKEIIENSIEPFETEEEVEEIEEVEEEEDDGIEIKEPPKKAPIRKKETKPRPPKTSAQLATVAKMLEAKRKNAELRRLEREADEAEHKKKLQEKIVKTAIKIKKKQIKQEKIIENADTDGEEDDIEEIKKVVKKRAVIKETVYTPAPAPRFSFI